MIRVNCLNKIAAVGTNLLTDQYEMTEHLTDAQVALVRSAAMHDLELPEGLEAIDRKSVV